MVNAPVRILGVDPGSRVTGWGIIDFRDNHARWVASGTLRTGNGEMGDRLRRIFEGLGEIVAAHAPAEIAIEKVFVQRNVASALTLGQARGAALLAGVTRELTLFEYSPNEVKLAVVGRGHAAKDQVQHMVRVLLTLAETPVSDEADALAVAICHGHTRQTLAHQARAAAAAGVPAGVAPRATRGRKRGRGHLRSR